VWRATFKRGRPKSYIVGATWAATVVPPHARPAAPPASSQAAYIYASERALSGGRARPPVSWTPGQEVGGAHPDPMAAGSRHPTATPTPLRRPPLLLAPAQRGGGLLAPALAVACPLCRIAWPLGVLSGALAFPLSLTRMLAGTAWPLAFFLAEIREQFVARSLLPAPLVLGLSLALAAAVVGVLPPLHGNSWAMGHGDGSGGEPQVVAASELAPHAGPTIVHRTAAVPVAPWRAPGGAAGQVLRAAAAVAAVALGPLLVDAYARSVLSSAAAAAAGAGAAAAAPLRAGLRAPGRQHARPAPAEGVHKRL
jgi:hypothetical protein